MKSPDQLTIKAPETIPSIEEEREKYLQFGEYTSDCPQWLLDKVALIDNSKIDEDYVNKVLQVIGDEFNSEKHTTTRTNDLEKSRLISVSDILEKRQKSCGSYATVIASVLRNLKIPTKLIHGRYIKDDPRMNHAWNEVNLGDDKWLPIDINFRDYKLDEYHIKSFETLDWSENKDVFIKK